MTALEAHHSDTEHAGGDADPSEAHLQPDDRDRPAHVVYDAVSEIGEADIGGSGTAIFLPGFIADTPLDGRYRITITEEP